VPGPQPVHHPDRVGLAAAAEVERQGQAEDRHDDRQDTAQDQGSAIEL